MIRRFLFLQTVAIILLPLLGFPESLGLASWNMRWLSELRRYSILGGESICQRRSR